MISLYLLYVFICLCFSLLLFVYKFGHLFIKKRMYCFPTHQVLHHLHKAKSNQMYTLVTIFCELCIGLLIHSVDSVFNDSERGSQKKKLFAELDELACSD